jgi:phosphatidylinositol kinase/protein kinase (PI-3  family)
MGGEKSEYFHQFCELCGKSYNLLRNDANLFISLFSLMISIGMPELKSHDDLNYLLDAFSLELNEDQAKDFFVKLIFKSLNTKTTQIMFATHILAHPGKES